MTDIGDNSATADFEDFAFHGSLDSWLEVLPSYQRRLLLELMESGKAVGEIPEVWLDAASTRSDTAPFSGQRFPSLFYRKFLDELHNLLCSNERSYKAERAKVAKQLGVGRTAVVAEIASILTQHLGAAESFLTPAIVVSLSLIGQTGLHAWCAAQSERRSATNPS